MTPPLRIAQIAPLHERVPPKLYGGTERVVSFLTEELVRQGHDVTLFASGDSETSARLVPCCEMALRLNPSVRNHLPYHMIMLEEVRQRLDQFEILHFHIDLLHSSLVRTIANRTLTTLHGRLDLPDLAPFYRTFREFPLVSISNDQQRYLRDDFRELGFEVTEGVGKTGVVGVMRNGKGPTAWLRADMDCNQVRETTGLPWVATEAQRLPDGTEVDVMHACGHDAHVTWLLGCAKAMVGLKDDWSGTLVVYAQPARKSASARRRWSKTGYGSAGFPTPTMPSEPTRRRARSASSPTRRACAGPAPINSTSPSPASAATAPRLR
jgi:hypothetical protein